VGRSRAWHWRKARSVVANVARICGALAGRKFEPLAQGKRPAIRMPESPLRVNEQTQRRAIDCLGLQGPAPKVVPGWSAEGIERSGIQPANAIDRPLRPTIKRVGETVPRPPARANAGHCSPQVQPKRNTVRAGAPSGNAGTLSSGSGCNAPLQARPRSAAAPAMLSSANEADVFMVDQPARLRKDVAILRAAVQAAFPAV